MSSQTCVVSTLTLNPFASASLLNAISVMALPLAMLKDLQMRTPAKIGLAGVFCCAFITVAFDILRAVETETRGGVEGSTALWTNLESAVAVIVSCLPTFTALFNTKNNRTLGKNRGRYRQKTLHVTDSTNFMGVAVAP